MVFAHAQAQGVKADTAAESFQQLAMPAAVHIDRNIVYAQYGAQQLKLDLYTPEKYEGKLPGIVVVRGGGWLTGDKEGFAPLAANLAAQGFIVACIQYRVFPDIEFPAPIQDVKAAVRWIRAEGTSYSIDVHAIGALGASAGGHLVALLGTSSGQPDLEGDGGNVAQSSKVQAVVALAPVANFSDLKKFDYLKLVDNPELARKVSPVTYVSRISPPLLLMQGTADKVIPYAQSEELLAAYKAAGASAELILFLKQDMRSGASIRMMLKSLLRHLASFTLSSIRLRNQSSQKTSRQASCYFGFYPPLHAPLPSRSSSFREAPSSAARRPPKTRPTTQRPYRAPKSTP